MTNGWDKISEATQPATGWDRISGAESTVREVDDPVMFPLPREGPLALEYTGPYSLPNITGGSLGHLSSEEAKMEFAGNVKRNFAELSNMRNWILGALTIAETAMPPSDSPLWTETGRELGIQPKWEAEGREQTQILDVMGTFIDPYTSWEKFQKYAWEHPLSLAIDATFAASVAKGVVKFGATLGVQSIYRGPKARYTAAFRGYNRAAHIGDIDEMARQYALWKESIPEYGEAALQAQELAEHITKLTKGFVPVEPPFKPRAYGIAPPVTEKYPGQFAIQRTEVQRWADDVVDWWKGHSDDYTATELATLEEVFKTVTTPEKIAQFNKEFVTMSQIPYNETVLNRLIAEGKILPETKAALNTWREVLRRRENRLIENGLLTAEEARERAYLATKQYTASVDDYQKAMTEWQATSEEWRLQGAPSEAPPKPVNPFELRKDMQLMQEFPELFELTGEGRIVSPMYYPHVMAEDLIRSTVRDVINRIGGNKIGEFQHNWAELFKTETYSKDVMNVLRRNVRRVNLHERDWNILKEVLENYDETQKLGWKPGSPVPKGYVQVYPEGARALRGAKLEEMVVELAERLRETKDMTAAERHILTEKLIDEFSGRTQDIVKAGNPRIIPKEIADHIKYHMESADPFFIMASDIGGIKDVWRAFVLPLRPAWLAINDTTNFLLTTIMGGLEGWPEASELARRGVRFPGVIAQDTVMAEMGATFGWSPKVVKALQDAKLGWLVNFNRKIHGSRFMKFSRTIAQFNQIRDSFYKRINLTAQMKKEFRAAGAAEQGMDIGTRTLTAAEVQEITRSGTLMIDVMEEVLRGAGTRGKNLFLRDMVSRASEMVYSYNKMTPWQRKYMARAIPFVGWQLFTTGFLFRLPTRFPGRAWVLKGLAHMGQDYVENTFRNHGIDPDTLPDYDRTAVPIGPPGEDGQVPVLRLSAFRIYDMLETTDYVRTLFSHPAVKALLEIGGVKSFPELERPSTPPDWPEDQLARRDMADIILEMGFGSAYDIVDKFVHPYPQYDVGGLVSPHPYEYPGEPRDQRNWRSDLSQYIVGASWTGMESFDMMERTHRKSRRNLEGMFRAITIDLKVVDEDGYPDVDEQVLRQSEIRADTEVYLQHAYAYLQQIENMTANTSDPEKLEELQRERNAYMGKVFRMENLLNTIINFGDRPGYIQPEMVYAK